MTLDRLDVNLVELLDEELAVLGVHNRLDGGAEHFQAVFFQDAVTVKGHSAVQRGLASECQENALRLLLLDDSLHEEGSYRKKIYLVGDTLRCLDSRNIGIDQDSLYAFLAHGLEGLGAGVVEFAGLTDFKGSRTQEQDFLYTGVDHDVYSILMNLSKRNSVSVGPLEASGWNCTEKKRLLLCRRPSLVPSFMLMNRGSQSAPRVSPSTA